MNEKIPYDKFNDIKKTIQDYYDKSIPRNPLTPNQMLGFNINKKPKRKLSLKELIDDITNSLTYYDLKYAIEIKEQKHSGKINKQYFLFIHICNIKHINMKSNTNHTYKVNLTKNHGEILEKYINTRFGEQYINTEVYPNYIVKLNGPTVISIRHKR